MERKQGLIRPKTSRESRENERKLWRNRKAASPKCVYIYIYAFVCFCLYLYDIIIPLPERDTIIPCDATRGMARKRRRARAPAEKEARKSAVPVTIALKAAAREQTMKKLTERRQGRSLDQYIPYTRSSGPLVACQSSVLPTVKPLSRLGFVTEPRLPER